MNEETWNKYLQWVSQGESFSRIRDDLARSGMHPDEIKYTLQELDRLTVERKIGKLNTAQGIQWTIAGSILALISLAVFVIASLPVMFFAAAGFASGMSMILLGKKKMSGRSGEQYFGRKEEFRKRA